MCTTRVYHTSSYIVYVLRRKKKSEFSKSISDKQEGERNEVTGLVFETRSKKREKKSAKELYKGKKGKLVPLNNFDDDPVVVEAVVL